VSRADVAALRQEYARATASQQWGEAAAVAVLLGFEPIAGHDRFAALVTRSGVDWDELLADQAWSSGERFLIGTAAGIWRGRRTEVDIAQVAFLSDDFLAAWLAMVTAAVQGHVPASSGGCVVIFHVPTEALAAELASWCAERDLGFTALPGEVR
jgi:hypothetical protein